MQRKAPAAEIDETRAGRAGARLEPAAAAGRLARLPWIDVARGAALVAMAVYHFSWDLAFFGFTEAQVASSPGWIVFARSIAGSFLALVGVSLVLAHRSGIRARPFLKRLSQVVAGAAAITLVTYLAFPGAYVFFGILHQIALASVLGLAFLRLPTWLVALAALFFLFGAEFLAGPAFNWRYLQFLGLMTYWPVSNDFVPVFPWFGVVLGGIVAGRLIVASEAARRVLGKPLKGPVSEALAFAGRYSLIIYLLHQPVLFGAVYAYAWLIYR
ncbi:heparan-alpha-glucosaminide N-acetyltransferase [Afifella pfennigii]|uniref:heparan-alpha-glucosaminide N-acetyltransferase n=1 Tax=Afifella pfennigii TaxID=209897 RepID=UPI000689A761|nr:heparan-alpha-glucosaminide N-acetyltransferase [Afifella pfennigii]